MLQGLAQLAHEYGDDTLRFTPGVLLPNVRAADASTVTRQLHALGCCDVGNPLAHLIACTGSSACAKGLADTKQDARQLAANLSQPLSIHLTGCLRSCAAAHVAPVSDCWPWRPVITTFIYVPQSSRDSVLCVSATLL